MNPLLHSTLAFVQRISRRVKEKAGLASGFSDAEMQLWMLACRAGVRRVYAIEETRIIDLARSLARDNGCEQRITFLRCNSRKIERRPYLDEGQVVYDIDFKTVSSTMSFDRTLCFTARREGTLHGFVGSWRAILHGDVVLACEPGEPPVRRCPARRLEVGGRVLDPDPRVRIGDEFNEPLVGPAVDPLTQPRHTPASSRLGRPCAARPTSTSSRTDRKPPSARCASAP